MKTQAICSLTSTSLNMFPQAKQARAEIKNTKKPLHSKGNYQQNRKGAY